MPRPLILPKDGRYRLCHVQAGVITALGELPGSEDARYFPNDETSRVAVLDTKRKRVGVFTITEEVMQAVSDLPFASLPRRCTGRVAIPIGEGVLVGGESHTGEALWWRHPTGTGGQWQAVDLPEALRKPGKSIDGLHIDGNRILAVDDVIVPRWLLTYRLSGNSAPVLERQLALTSHMAQEHIIDSHLGEHELWLVSRGVNRSGTGGFVWAIDRSNFRERGCWSGFTRHNAEGGERPALATAVSAVEWCDHLWVACGNAGLHRIALRRKRKCFYTEPAEHIEGTHLADVRRVVPAGRRSKDGLIVCGRNDSGMIDSEWLAAPIKEPDAFCIKNNGDEN